MIPLRAYGLCKRSVTLGTIVYCRPARATIFVYLFACRLAYPPMLSMLSTCQPDCMRVSPLTLVSISASACPRWCMCWTCTQCAHEPQ
eukprot:10971728-Alexandrium_andersonii.AAC.1